MLLNIEGTTSLLAQVVTPKTYLSALITLDGRVVAFHIHPSAIVADEEEQSDGSDQAKIAAAIASGLWREDCYERPLPSTSKTELAQEVRNLDAVCEVCPLALLLNLLGFMIESRCIRLTEFCIFWRTAWSTTSQLYPTLFTSTCWKSWIGFARDIINEGRFRASLLSPVFRPLLPTLKKFLARKMRLLPAGHSDVLFHFSVGPIVARSIERAVFQYLGVYLHQMSYEGLRSHPP
jgi:hypothetical protein